MMRKLTHQFLKGFTLMEMLIALVVLSVGLLGIAALQSRGQQFNYAAYLYTQASFLAYDMMDRIRNNNAKDASQARNGVYAVDLPEGACPNSDMKERCQGTDLCSAAELAQFDLYQWCTSLQNTLPGGEATIEWVAATASYKITIKWWRENRTDKDSEKRGLSWEMAP